MKIILHEQELIIDNITNIKSFNDKEFILYIDNEQYHIIGNDLILKEVYNNNTSIKILGDIYLIEKKGKLPIKNKKGFINKLFS